MVTRWGGLELPGGVPRRPGPLQAWGASWRRRRRRPPQAGTCLHLPPPPTLLLLSQNAISIPALHTAEDYKLQELCELRHQQYFLACLIQELESKPASEPQRCSLPGLHISLDWVNAQLLLQEGQQQQQRPAPSAGQGSGH